MVKWVMFNFKHLSKRHTEFLGVPSCSNLYIHCKYCTVYTVYYGMQHLVKYHPWDAVSVLPFTTKFQVKPSWIGL